jgi:dynein heavy chain 1
MVWFSEDVLSTEMIFENYMSRLRNIPLEEADEDSGFGKKSENKEDVLSPALQVFCMACFPQTC